MHTALATAATSEATGTDAPTDPCEMTATPASATSPVMRWLGREGAGNVPYVGGVYSLVDALWLLWDPRRQCLHDKLPGTVVVRSR